MKTIQNIQNKAVQILELANALEQSAQNARVEEVANIIGQILTMGLSVADSICEIDKNMMVAVLGHVNDKMMSMIQPEDTDPEEYKEDSDEEN